MNNYFEVFFSLISSFLSGVVAAPAFKADYMKLWRDCRDAGEFSGLNRETEQAFDRIFTACDCYCEDPLLRDPGDLDEKQFWEEIVSVARGLRS